MSSINKTYFDYLPSDILGLICMMLDKLPDLENMLQICPCLIKRRTIQNHLQTLRIQIKYYHYCLDMIRSRSYKKCYRTGKTPNIIESIDFSILNNQQRYNICSAFVSITGDGLEYIDGSVLDQQQYYQLCLISISKNHQNYKYVKKSYLNNVQIESLKDYIKKYI